MFLSLKKKVEKNLNEKLPQDESTVISRYASSEYIEKVGYSDITDSNRKDEHVKRLETKISEFGAIIRDKSSKLDTVTKELELIRSDYQKQIQNLIEQNRLDCQESALKFADYPSLQKKLANYEKEIVLVRAELESCMSELDKFRREAVQLKKENSAKDENIYALKNLREKELDEMRLLQNSMKDLQTTNFDLSKKYEETTANLDQVKHYLAKQEHIFMVNTDKAVESEHRANQLQIRLTNLESRASDREADMKDRIRLLEERLVAITEATLLSSSSKADLSSASTSRGDLPIASPDVSPFISPNDSASDICVEKMLSQPTTNASGPVAVNPEKNMLLSVALLAERRILESHLETTRVHLAEVKTEWHERLVSLESQIEHLNTKIAEDAIDLNDAQRCLDEVRTQNSHKVCLLQTELIESRDLVYRLEQSVASSRIAQEAAESASQERYLLLEAQLAGLEEQAKQLTSQRSEARQRCQELQSKNDQLSLDASGTLESIAQKDRELASLQIQLEAYSNDIFELKSERLTKDRELTNLRSKVASLMDEVENITKQSEQARLDLATLQGEAQNNLEARLKAECVLADESNRWEISKAEFKAHITRLQVELQAGLNLVEEISSSESRLRRQLSELEYDRDKVSVAIESNEVALLKQSLLEKEETVAQKEELIRTLKQKLSELKRALEQHVRIAHPYLKPAPGLAVQTAAQQDPKQTSPSQDFILADIPVPVKSEPEVVLNRKSSLISYEGNIPPLTSEHQYNPGSTNSLPSKLEFLNSVSTLPMPTTGTNPILIRDSEVAFRFDDCKPSKTGPAYSTKKKARSETVVAMAPSCFDRPMASNYGLSQENGFLEGAHQLVDPINFRYLRHVVLKFVLSRENEALLLVRALATLLKLSSEEEDLLRHTLKAKRSWFPASSMPSAFKARGQFSKVIPPFN